MSLKRPRSTSSSSGPPPSKVTRLETTFAPPKVASSESAAVVDHNPPLPQLLRAVDNAASSPEKGACVVYWMRMQDMRVHDNRALKEASKKAKSDDVPLVSIYILSPQDYVAHDQGGRQIDFMLRSLAKIKTSLEALHIPLAIINVPVRRTLPPKVIEFLKEWGATQLFANIEYEVDELRRDIKVSELASAQGIRSVFLHNKCIIPPGVVKTKEDKTYTVYSPYLRQWTSQLNSHVDVYLEDYGQPFPNNFSVNTNQFAEIFQDSVPTSIAGFELEENDKATMSQMWPAGEAVAQNILQRFLNTQARNSQMGCVDPLADGATELKKRSRISLYHEERDAVFKDSSSRLSPYLALGVISVRYLVRETMKLQKNAKKVDASKDTGIGRWVQELAWRDFYVNILAGYPRVSMGRPFSEKMANVVWEEFQHPEHMGISPASEKEKGAKYRGIREGGDDNSMLRSWKEGNTGYPIVDATMRCLKKCGWVHNRGRMIAAMFLTKDLMIDWRVGERYFMQTLIDADLASNNGGWQWSASTGVDAAPYFRIFNPHSQSQKVDPHGDFIRYWVPELAKVEGSGIHNPSSEVAKHVGYPLPIVKHAESRERAIRRFKDPGAE